MSVSEENLSKIPTNILFEELKGREGVEAIWVDPNQPYNINIDEYEVDGYASSKEKIIADGGPCWIVIITD